MVGDGGEMAPLRLQEFLTGNAPADHGPITAGFGPAVNERYADEAEEDLANRARRHTGNFNFGFDARAAQDDASDDEFNPDADQEATGAFGHLNEKKPS